MLNPVNMVNIVVIRNLTRGILPWRQRKYACVHYPYGGGLFFVLWEIAYFRA